MRNWSTDTNKLSKYPKKYLRFKLESLINFGAQEEKMKESDLKKELQNLDIDPKKKQYLTMLLS